MTAVTKAVLCACALGLVAASPAAAQGPLYRGFLSVNFGVQATSRSHDESGTFELYGETGTVEGTREVGAGPLFDVSGGFIVWKNILVGVGYSRFSDQGDVALEARVPDPLHFDRPRSAAITLADAAHTEHAFHVQALYALQLTEKLDVMLGGGPSFFSLTQDVLDEIVATEGSTLTVTGTTASVSESAVGFNVGADLTYLFTDRLGAGFFARYSEASVNMPAGEGATRDVKVGGFQLGAGLRFRF
jgi:opacity protein-like surface antigen